MKSQPLTVAELSELLSCKFDGDGDLVLNGVATMEEAQEDNLTFLANPKYRCYLENCRAGAILISDKEIVPPGIVRIISNNPYQSFRRAIEILYPKPEIERETEIHSSAVINPTVKLGNNLIIAPFVHIEANSVVGDNTIISTGVYVGEDVKIGRNCRIGRNVVIRHDVTLGDRVAIFDGTVIGSEGFGYTPDESGFTKIREVGTVEIADDVEIGANCCIDRATVGATRIGKGTKLDNLIQVAHGVQIGEHTVIAAQTGISGSARIGSRVMMGGQVGVNGHISIGDGMIVGAQAGVVKTFDIKGMISGYPARPHAQALKLEAAMARLPKLYKKINELQAKLDELESNR